ncbi:hypothetical protein QTP86_015659, partial [Hemibagrus guttatus]
MISIGSKSDLVKHVVSFRRFTYMILNSDITELERTLTFKIDGFEYVIFVSTDSMKCFGCGKTGHLVHMCPQAAAGEDRTSGGSSASAQDRAEPEKTNQMDGEVGATSATSEGAESVSATAACHDTEKPVGKPAEVLSTETDPVHGERRAAATDSLHWLLKEPLILGARLDIAGNALTQTLLTSGVITLGHLVDLAGPELNDADGAAACLRLRSTRTIAQLLQKWHSALSPEEKGMLMEYCGGIEWPDEEDPFPELTLSPDLEGSTGHFLE